MYKIVASIYVTHRYLHVAVTNICLTLFVYMHCTAVNGDCLLASLFYVE